MKVLYQEVISVEKETSKQTMGKKKADKQKEVGQGKTKGSPKVNISSKVPRKVTLDLRQSYCPLDTVQITHVGLSQPEGKEAGVFIPLQPVP